MQSQFVETNNIKLHVMTDGPDNGPSVVLLHGFPEFHYGWRKQVPALAAAGFRVIAPDQRGYNLSDKPKSVHAYDVDFLVKDILGLFDHFGVQKAKLVGHDWGAAVAWALALDHADRLEKLAILNVPHPDVMARFMRTDRAQQRKSWYVFFFQIPLFVEWALRRNNFEALARTLVQSGRRQTFSGQDIAEYKKAWSQAGALTAMLSWYRAAVRRGFKSFFLKANKSPRRVSVPTLILWGKHDSALSLAMVQPSLELCDRGEAVIFDKATHWVQHDEPDEVNKRLIRFMS